MSNPAPRHRADYVRVVRRNPWIATHRYRHLPPPNPRRRGV